MSVKVCQTVLSAGFEPVVVVTGYEHEKVEQSLAGFDIHFVKNDNWQSGMAGSIYTGMSTLPKDVIGNMIVLGDMPYLTVSTLNMLKTKFESADGENIVYPSYKGQQANPVIFPRKHFQEILSSTGDRGCKRVLNKYPEDSIVVAMDSNEVVLDCDTEEDYLALIRKREHEHVSA